MIAVGFVVAAGLGAVARWHLGRVYGRLAGTLVANLIGSFLLGLLVGQSEGTSTVVGVAGLGALTTWSSFIAAVMDVAVAERERAVRYATVSIVGGVAVAWLGLQMG